MSDSQASGPPRTLLRAARDLTGWLAEHGVPRVRALCATLGLALTLALAAAGAALWGFVSLGEEIAEGETLALDRAALRWIEARQTPALDRVAVEITSLGAGVVVAAMALVAAGFLTALGRRRDVLALVVAVTGGFVLNGSLKAAYGRERPDVFEWLVTGVGSGSFPSGHALHAAVLATVLAWLLMRLQRRPWARRLTAGLAAAVVGLVALSRVYLGVHYPTDVLAGAAVGYAWAMVCVLAAHVLEAARRGPPA